MFFARIRSKAGIAALIGLSFLAVSIMYGVIAWQVATSHPWTDIPDGHDNILLGTIYNKDFDSTLYQTDYLYKDNRYYAFYTPSFLQMLHTISEISGIGNDFPHALGVLQGPLLFSYLVFAFLLFWQATRSYLIAFVLAFLSTVGVFALSDFWSVLTLFWILPRTVALPVVVLTMAMLLYLLNPNSNTPRKSLLKWGILGVLGGMVANFHPTTGIAFALTLGLVVLMYWLRTRQNMLVRLLMMSFGVLIGSAPIVFNILSQTSWSSRGGKVDFIQFANYFQAQSPMPPLQIGRLAQVSTEQQIWLQLSWVVLTFVTLFLLRPNRRSIFSLLFGTVQLVFTWIIAQSLMSDFLLIGALFLIWRWWIYDEGRELILFEVMACIIGVSFVLPVTLKWLWLNGQIWALTSFISEIPRGARLLTIPVFLVYARLAYHLIHYVQERCTKISLKDRSRIIWTLFGGVAAIMLYYYLTITAVLRLVIYLPILLLLVLADVWFMKTAFYNSFSGWRKTLLDVSLGIIAVIFTLVNVRFYEYVANAAVGWVDPLIVIPVVGIALGSVFWIAWRRYFAHRVMYAIIPVSLSTILFTLAIITVKSNSPTLSASSDEAPPIVDAALWAREHTDKNALFYFAVLDLPTTNASTFRFWSRRSITHSFKDLNLILYANFNEAIPAVQRYQRLVNATSNETSLISMANELHASYILRNPSDPLSLPIVYQNEAVAIYCLKCDWF